MLNETLPVPAVPVHAAANHRRSIVLALPFAVLALVVLALVGHPIAGIFVVVGLALGAVNSRLVQLSVLHYAEQGSARKQRFVGGVLFRLGVITLIALIIVLLDRPDGLGVLGGLAVFQLLMIGNASVPIFRELRKS